MCAKRSAALWGVSSGIHLLAKKQNLIAEIPVKTPPKKRRLEDKTVCILECGGQVH